MTPKLDLRGGVTQGDLDLIGLTPWGGDLDPIGLIPWGSDLDLGQKLHIFPVPEPPFSLLLTFHKSRIME